MFTKLFSFNGRIRRTDYAVTLILYVLIVVAAGATLGRFLGGIELLVLYIPLLWIVYAQGAKRCHDIGRSGWYQIIPLYILWMLFEGGQPCNNDYGPDPKGDQSEDVIKSIGNQEN